VAVGTLFFEDVEPGDEHESPWTPTTPSVVAYMNVSERFDGADGRFTDPEAARRLGLEGPIVPGAFSLSVLARIVDDWAGIDGRVRSVDVRFRRPVLHDDDLTAVALVTDTEEADDPGLGRVKLDVFLQNDRGDRPVQGVAVVDLPRRA